MNSSDWQHYGTHWDAETARSMRMPNRFGLAEISALHVRWEWLDESIRESWESLAAEKFRYLAVMRRRGTQHNDVEIWLSRSREFHRIWKNRHHPKFPFEIIIFMKINL